MALRRLSSSRGLQLHQTCCSRLLISRNAALTCVVWTGSGDPHHLELVKESDSSLEFKNLAALPTPAIRVSTQPALSMAWSLQLRMVNSTILWLHWPFCGARTCVLLLCVNIVSPPLSSSSSVSSTTPAPSPPLRSYVPLLVSPSPIFFFTCVGS